MRRGLWFVAGAGAGVWAMTRARRVAEAFTPDGLRDRVNGLVVGARMMREEFAAGAAETETAVRDRMGLLEGPRALTTSASAGEALTARTPRDTDHVENDDKDDN